MINYLSKPFIWFFKLEAASGLILLFSPTQALVVVHSPTPSIQRIKDFLNGLGKNAAAAWE